MAYISSNNNRWYCQVENSYGQVGQVSANNRFPASTMSVQQKVQVPKRKDKTGTRTFLGVPAAMKKTTNFSLTTFMTSWPSALPGYVGSLLAPAYGPLFQAALGAGPFIFTGGVAAAGCTSTSISFSAPHGLISGQAITFNGELRFVWSVTNANSVQLNAPFSSVPGVGATIGPTITYLPTTELPSISVFDYWTPTTAVQRLLCGCGINQLDIAVNSDYQDFVFQGSAQDVIDSSSFTSGQGQLTAFPSEPPVGSNPASTVIPGHLGQAWLGTLATNILSLTSAKVTLKNSLTTRANEFGHLLPAGLIPGNRSVDFDFQLYGQDDSTTISLYQAARQRSLITAGFQLGQSNGELFGMYMKSVVPQVPDFLDKDVRLQWSFQGSQAQGLGDDELAVAFG